MKASSAVLMILCLWAFSCAPDKPKPTPQAAAKTKPEEPKLVGRIASIPADKRFVLIQSYGKWSVAAGSVLTTRGPDNRAANLLATGEALGEFAAADLQSGSVETGDAVYLQPIPKPSDPANPLETAPPRPIEATGNVQNNI